MSARKPEPPVRKSNEDLTPADRERMAVIHALKVAGSTPIRGTLDTIAHMATILANIPAGMVAETFILSHGWTVVFRKPLEDAPKA